MSEVGDDDDDVCCVNVSLVELARGWSSCIFALAGRHAGLTTPRNAYPSSNALGFMDKSNTPMLLRR